MFFMFDNEPPAAMPIDFLALPGFAEAKRHLEDVGRPSAWITELVDTLDKHATFLKDGRPWYKSRCPNYEGYWLEGGTGSVQCGSYGGLDAYEKYCDAHPEYPNNRAILAIENIRETYMERLKKRDFLQESSAGEAGT